MNVHLNGTKYLAIASKIKYIYMNDIYKHVLTVPP